MAQTAGRGTDACMVIMSSPITSQSMILGPQGIHGPVIGSLAQMRALCESFGNMAIVIAPGTSAECSMEQSAATGSGAHQVCKRPKSVNFRDKPVAEEWAQRGPLLPLNQRRRRPLPTPSNCPLHSRRGIVLGKHTRATIRRRSALAARPAVYGKNSPGRR
jgi:hypothetical protein